MPDKVSDLTPSPKNPRKISKSQLEMLGKALKEFGDLSGIVFNRQTGHLVGGHQRIKKLEPEWIIWKEDVEDPTGTRARGHIQTPFGRLSYREVDWTEQKELAANIAANKHGGEFDWSLVNQLLTEIDDGQFDMDLTGFDELERKALIDSYGDTKVPSGDIPEPGAAPEEPITKPGDLIKLGRHRLLCADATKAESWETLMLGERAAMCFTDPPWNVAIGKRSGPKHREREGLKNDDLDAEEFQAFLMGFALQAHKWTTGDLYCVLATREWPVLDASLRTAGFHWSSVIVWVKDSFVIGRSNYHQRFEPIWYGWPKKLKSSYRGGRNQDTVWEFPRPKVSEEHPTMKPPELVQKAITNSSSGGDLVVDPFLGSGTTLLAAESLDRRCFGFEIEPKFCDVIVKRWEQFTGKNAIREGRNVGDDTDKDQASG